MTWRISWACWCRPGLWEGLPLASSGCWWGRWDGQKTTGQEVLNWPWGEWACAQHEQGKAASAPGGTSRSGQRARYSAIWTVLRAPGRLSSWAANPTAVTPWQSSSSLPGCLSLQGVLRPCDFTQNDPKVCSAGVSARDDEVQAVCSLGGWLQPECGAFPLSFPPAHLPLSSCIWPVWLLDDVCTKSPVQVPRGNKPWASLLQGAAVDWVRGEICCVWSARRALPSQRLQLCFSISTPLACKKFILIT